jgi:hypothetical protein
VQAGILQPPSRADLDKLGDESARQRFIAEARKLVVTGP